LFIAFAAIFAAMFVLITLMTLTSWINLKYRFSLKQYLTTACVSPHSTYPEITLNFLFFDRVYVRVQAQKAYKAIKFSVSNPRAFKFLRS